MDARSSPRFGSIQGMAAKTDRRPQRSATETSVARLTSEARSYNSGPLTFLIRRRARSAVDADHHIRGVDDGIRVLPGGQPEVDGRQSAND